MEQLRLGLQSPTHECQVPLCVQQWNGLIAVNYPARAFGIARHSTVQEAKQKCPHVQLVHVATYAHGETEPKYHEHVSYQSHKVSLDFYRNASVKIMKIIQRFTKRFQRASIGMDSF